MQVSAYIDQLIAEPAAAPAPSTGLQNASTLYTLPVSLFGMSVSAAELPAMSGIAAPTGGIEAVRVRLDAGLRQIAFFVVPSAVAFLALGDVVAGALLQTGRFTHDDAIYVWADSRGIGGRAAGLDARPPVLLDLLRASRHPDAAAVRDRPRGADDGARVSVAIPLPRLLGIAAAWGAAGLTASAGHRGLGRDAAAALDAERADRSNRIAGGVRRAAVGSGGRRGARSRGASSSRCRRCTRS